MEDAFDETLEAHTPEGFSSSKCFSDEGGFSLQGADHPSPVSVLDSPIFQEGFHLEELSTSPDSVRSIMVLPEGSTPSPILFKKVTQLQNRRHFFLSNCAILHSQVRYLVA